MLDLNGIQRRTFLRTSTAGIGTAVLGALFGPQRGASVQAATPEKLDKWMGTVRPLHHPAKIKRVIYLCMAGGPSHLETWDYKPELAKMHGQGMPESESRLPNCRGRS